jgi:methionyl aminopeptidase
LLTRLFQEELGISPDLCPELFNLIKDTSTNLLLPQTTHKAVHKSQSNLFSKIFPPKVVSKPDPITGTYNPFPTFPFTGPLRPVYPLSERRAVPKTIHHPDYAQTGVPESERRLGGRNKIEILDKKQQEGMRKVCRLAREVLDIAAAAAVPGVTTDYIDDIVHKACLERDVSSFVFLFQSRN